MSVQFGIWNFDGQPVDPGKVHAADSFLSPFGPDGLGTHTHEGFTVRHHALWVTLESHSEKQPFVSKCGFVIAWDGRLDNREELIRDFGMDTHITDVEVVAACFDRWSAQCLSKLKGDWALSAWNPRGQTLILARDLMGVRPLYYQVTDTFVRWSSVLEPLVILSGQKFQLDMGYVAGWLGMYPAADTTPYVGIRAVPPSSSVLVGLKRAHVVQYWDFDPHKRIVYGSDHEYEEHFRALFRQAVRRRLRSQGTICAELSGGMDSNSVVAMADDIAKFESTPDVVTLSYYDESEANANELPFIQAAEEKRGRKGFHIPTEHTHMFSFDEDGPFHAIPDPSISRRDAAPSPQTLFYRSQGIRVVLSGIGGDEVMGGVPTPTCELQDLIRQGDFRRLAHQLKLWALNKRTPWLHLFCRALMGFMPLWTQPTPKHFRPATWLQRDFANSNIETLQGFLARTTWSGGLPSFQAFLSAVGALRRQLGTKGIQNDPPYEKCYPFFDRDLLEFLAAIPREQLLRPGYRRSLMRRALADLVPREIFERKRKAFVSRGPRAAVTKEWDALQQLTTSMAISKAGIADEKSFRTSLLHFRDSEDVSLLKVMRTVIVECWLRNVFRHGVICELNADAEFTNSDSFRDTAVSVS